MKETDLAKRCVDYLRSDGWDVYEEVQFATYGGIADIVAVRAGIVWVIECKRSLGLRVMDQAVRWRAHRRSVCVPHRRILRIEYEVLEFLKIGLIRVSSSVEESVTAPLIRSHHVAASKMRDVLCKEHKQHARAGTSSGGHYTPFRGTMERVVRYIRQNPGCTLRDVLESTRHHYASDASARGAIRQWLGSEHTLWGSQVRVEGTRPARYYPA